MKDVLRTIDRTVYLFEFVVLDITSCVSVVSLARSWLVFERSGKPTEFTPASTSVDLSSRYRINQHFSLSVT